MTYPKTHSQQVEVKAFNSRLACKGVQDMPLPNMPLWHSDYFELKALEKAADSGRALQPSSFYLQAGPKISQEKGSPPCLRRQMLLLPETRVNADYGPVCTNRAKHSEFSIRSVALSRCPTIYCLQPRPLCLCLKRDML